MRQAIVYHVPIVDAILADVHDTVIPVSQWLLLVHSGEVLAACALCALR